MKRYFWKFRYFNLLLIVILLIINILNVDKIQVYFDSERIISLADTNKDIIDKALDDKDLLLVGLELNDSLLYEELLLISEKISNNLIHKNISSVRSIFNEKEYIFSSIIPISIKLLNLNDLNSYNKSLERIKIVGSDFISKDFKNLLLVIRSKNLNNDIDKNNLLEYLKKTFSNLDIKNVNITGQIKSELYMQKNVMNELIYFSLFSIFLCSVILWFLLRNINLVFINLFSVIISLIFSFSISNYLFGGIELVMIIIPAVVFIITVSDYMHLLNINKKYKNKYRMFYSQMFKIGMPVFLTSITTAIGFLSFVFTEFQPLMRFGVITTISIFISLFVIITFFTFCVDFNLLKLNNENNTINRIIYYIFSLSKNKEFILVIFILLSIFGVLNIKTNNFLTDEINDKSSLLKEINYFDEKFGGIKPITFTIDNTTDFKKIDQFVLFLKKNNIQVDVRYNKNKNIVFKSRMQDLGTIESNNIYNRILLYANNNDIKCSISGIGYLFDKISNNLTREVLFGLIFAILIICSLFVFINNLNINYFIVTLLPNIVPLFACLGILSFSGFYFSLSNAFIFAIVFGLIVDDSIHIISAYSIKRKRNHSINKSIKYCRSYVFKAITKTTIVIIVALLPLLFSEFKSISQLAYITIISAVIAIIFDLLFLPSLLKKIIK